MKFIQKIICKIFVIYLLSNSGNLGALTVGNFTAQDYQISIKDNKEKFLVDNFLIKEQHYTDLGTILDDQLPLTLSIWEKDETNLDESTILNEFVIEHVPSLKIEVHSTDIWIVYTDENNELQVTNLAKQVKEEEKVTVDLKAKAPGLEKLQAPTILFPKLTSKPRPQLQPELQPQPEPEAQLKPENKDEDKPKIIQLQSGSEPELIEKIDDQPKEIKLQTEAIPLVPLEPAESPDKK